MTDSFLPVDAVLWSVAIGLLAVVLWLNRSSGPTWDPAAFFGAVLSALFGPGHLPLTGGPVPPEGFEGTPEELAAVDDPRVRLGPECGWPEVGAWTDATVATVSRRLQNVRVVWFEPPVVTLDGLEATTLEAVELAGVEPLLDRPDARLVLAASARADAVLRLLHDAPGLRDRVRAVLLVAPALDADWLRAHFTHPEFDVEVSREVPYVTLRSGPEADAQTLPKPPPPPTGRKTLAAIDLGVLPPALLPDPRVGRALAALCAALG